VSLLGVVGLVLPPNAQRAQRKAKKLRVLSDLCGKKQRGDSQQHFTGTLPEEGIK
jgi:hypothetical protein